MTHYLRALGFDNMMYVLLTIRICLLFVQIAWKQWLLPSDVYWCQNGMADLGTSAESADVPGSALPLRRQYTICTASVASNHCFPAIRTDMNRALFNHNAILLYYTIKCGHTICTYSYWSGMAGSPSCLHNVPWILRGYI